MSYFGGSSLERKVKEWQLEELVNLVRDVAEGTAVWPGPCTITAEDEGQVELLRNVLYSILNQQGLKLEYRVKRLGNDLVLDRVDGKARVKRLIKFNQTFSIPQFQAPEPGETMQEDLSDVFSPTKNW